MLTTCIITPSYIGDIEQFSLLRKSVELYAKDFQHIVIVHSEDHGAFQVRFGGSPNITILKTSDVLPSFIERRRKTKIKLMNSLKKRLFSRNLIEGWHIQQLTKIYALTRCKYDSAAFIDSDVFLCKPLSLDYFMESGKLKLFRRAAINAEQMDFDISTHEMVGNDLHKVTQLYYYIFQLSCFKKFIAESLLNFLSNRYGDLWVDKFFSVRMLSDYILLG